MKTHWHRVRTSRITGLDLFGGSCCSIKFYLHRRSIILNISKLTIHALIISHILYAQYARINSVLATAVHYKYYYYVIKDRISYFCHSDRCTRYVIKHVLRIQLREIYEGITIIRHNFARNAHVYVLCCFILANTRIISRYCDLNIQLVFLRPGVPFFFFFLRLVPYDFIISHST